MTYLNNQQIKKLEEQAVQDKYRLKYHLMPPTGWLNDPNGLCQLKDTYHIYYQYSPDNCLGGDKYWGHYSTKDFITFKNESIPLFPDSSFDKNGVYSGSAIVKDDKMYVYYTGNVKHPGNYDYIITGREHNTIMVTSNDGINFSEKKCLMANKDYPDDLSLHVRDPQIIRYKDHYLMALGARTKDDVGCVILYRSDDLKNWTYQSRIEAQEQFGYMWECPNLVILDKQMILFCCPQGVEKDGYNHENLYQNGYYIVNGDIEGKYQLSNFIDFDHGFDFYAPQLFKDQQERTIMIGWMGLPDVPYTNPTVESKWQHALTLPRQLLFKNGKVYQYPITETKQLRKEKQIIDFQNSFYSNTSCYELHLPILNQEFTLTLKDGIVIDYHDHLLTFKMGKCGYGRDTRHIVIDKLEKMVIFSDTSSLELFINDGEYALTSRVYDELNNPEIAIDINVQGIYYELDGYKIV